MLNQRFKFRKFIFYQELQELENLGIRPCIIYILLNYKELKQNITKIINYLEKASNSLSLPINNLDSYYVIDKKKSVIQERMENLRSEMNKTKNYLKDNVINEINQKL